MPPAPGLIFWPPVIGPLFLLIFMISANLKQYIWYQGRIQNPVKNLKAANIFTKRSMLKVWQGFGYGSLFETKKFIVLKLTSTLSLHQKKKNFEHELNASSSWIGHARSSFLCYKSFRYSLLTKKVTYLGETFKIFSKFVTVKSSY